jgi:1-acyl-sn-glycerol-3-phosphate acyltransferase
MLLLAPLKNLCIVFSMSDPRQRAAELRPDLDIPWSNRALMSVIFNVAAPVLFHPKIHFEGEEAGQALWKEHVESDAPTMVIMSHAEEVDAVLMAPIAQGKGSKALRQMKYETLVVAKDTLRNLPYGAGFIVRNGGTTSIEREYEYPNETPEQKALRKKRNLHSRDVGTTVLEAGGNMVVYIEGQSAKRVKLPDGTFKRVARIRDEMLPAQIGFAHMINETSPETREKLRIMTIVSRYSDRPLRLLRPTTVILEPVKPVDGDAEAIRLQGQELLARGYERVIELDEQRRS